ncbi:MAG TPA: TIGR02680 family protein, partial [Telluria sp.]
SRAAARRLRIAQIGAELDALVQEVEQTAASLVRLAECRAVVAREWRAAPSDADLRTAHVTATALEQQRRQAAERQAQAEEGLRAAEQAWRAARAQLHQDAEDLGLPSDAAGLALVVAALARFDASLQDLLLRGVEARHALPEYVRQAARTDELARDLDVARANLAQRDAARDEADARLRSLRERVGAQIDELERQLARVRAAVAAGGEAQRQAGETLRDAGKTLARSEQRVEDADRLLAERTGARQQAVHALERFSATGLLAVALPSLDSGSTAWTIDGALNIARRTEQALQAVVSDDAEWSRVQNAFSHDYTSLLTALTALGHQAQAETTDFGMVVTILYQNRSQRPDLIEASLRDEIAQRQALLTARETEVLENHLQAEVAAAIQRMLREAEARRNAINVELAKRPTSTGVKFRLDWQALPEGADGAPVGLDVARQRLLNTSFDAWSPQDREVVGTMLQNRITAERMRADGESASLLEMLARALDYRRWHRFRVQRWQDGQWRPLSGPASSGERALGLTVPLFAAVSSFYTHGGSKDAPRLVLLDEAFAGIDDAARAHCMALVREFDLD